jgi:hypothetical protein
MGHIIMPYVLHPMFHHNGKNSFVPAILVERSHYFILGKADTSFSLRKLVVLLSSISIIFLLSTMTVDTDTTEDQLLRIVGEGDEENQGNLLKPGSQGFPPNEEEMPRDQEPEPEPDEVEIVLNDEEEEAKPKNGFGGGFGSRNHKSSLAAAAIEESSELYLGGSTKRGDVAVIETDDTLEAQTVDGDISIIDSNGNATRVTLMEKPRSRRRLYILFALLCLAIVCAIAALLVGLLNDRTKEESFESTNREALPEEDETDGDTTGDENLGNVFGNKSSLATGCFQYTGGFLVCLSDEGADDGLCSVTVDGEACESCTVCDAERGTVRVDCSNVVQDLLVINDECIDTADAFDDTMLEGFLIGNDGGFEGSIVDPAGQGDEDGDQAVGGGATDGEDNLNDGEDNPDGGEDNLNDGEDNPDGGEDNPDDVPDDGVALEPNYTTGCFDYNFRLNQGAAVCLFDEDPTDDVCTISVDGQDCAECTVCDRDAGTIRADCTNLPYSPVINQACSSDNSVYQGTLLEAFMGAHEDANNNDGKWVDASEVPEDGVVCDTRVESDYICYATGTSVDVSFVSCEFESDDWIGIFADTADPSAMGTPANNQWVWACDANSKDCEVMTQSDIHTFTAGLDGLDAGSYKAFLIRRNINGPDEAYSWSDAFQVKDNAADCDFR